LHIDERDLCEWQCYFELYPFGEDVGHLMLARIMSAFSGKNEQQYMPRIQEDEDIEEA
jgi:hypothetical protein